ncbi:MAG TPA: hypothetical protein VK427_21685, partial [Kofleriaceae bacterium]|nr:hypothetical protein [Kofleriaceae bacterium]
CLGLDATKRPTLAEVVTRLRAMIDWTDDVTVERAAAIANPADYQARVAAFRVRRLERTAREALAAGKPFLALAHCDRGLAYTPDDATFVSLIAEAESSTAPAKRRHVWWIVGGVIAMAVALGYAMYERTDDDPWQARRSTVPTTPVDHGDGDVRDKALLRDVMGLFGKALDAAKTAPPVSVQHATPTTALGWLARAKTQQPADAVVSLRHALSLSPDWPEAQDLLCATLAATKDDTAIDVCTTSIERDATNVAVRAARGLALVDANRHADALADLDVVIAADPAPRWRRVRATARAASGDQRGAQQDLANACELGDAIACQARR